MRSIKWCHFQWHCMHLNPVLNWELSAAQLSENSCAQGRFDRFASPVTDSITYRDGVGWCYDLIRRGSDCRKCTPNWYTEGLCSDTVIQSNVVRLITRGSDLSVRSRGLWVRFGMTPRSHSAPGLTGREIYNRGFGLLIATMHCPDFEPSPSVAP